MLITDIVVVYLKFITYNCESCGLFIYEKSRLKVNTNEILASFMSLKKVHIK